MLLTSLALMAAPVQGTPCFGDHRIEIRGVIDTVLQAPTAPFQSIASGDLAELDLAFAGDVGCITAAQLDGRLATPHCCELRIGGAVAPLDAGAAPCLWGEVYSGPPAWQTEAVEADAPFAGGTVWAELRMTDPQGLVGIGMDDLIHAPIDVPSVTAAGFSVSLELKDSHGALLATVDVLEILGTPGFQTGGNYCTANANSTGLPARMAFSGSWDLAQNDFTIAAMDLPQQSFAFFLVSATQGFIPNPAGSAGNLCVMGNIGRFVGPGEIQYTGMAHAVSIPVDLTQLPQATGPIYVQAGQTWNFTCWFRDVTPTSSSNFADGLSVTFY